MPDIVRTELARDYVTALVLDVMTHLGAASLLQQTPLRPPADDPHAHQHAVLARAELTRLQVLHDLCRDAWAHERPTVELSDELLLLEQPGHGLPASLLSVVRGPDAVRAPADEDLTSTSDLLHEVPASSTPCSGTTSTGTAPTGPTTRTHR